MSNNADAPGDANPSDAVPGDHAMPTQAPRDADVDKSTLSRNAPRIVDNPPVALRVDTARDQRALRRMKRRRNAPSWVKKIPWFLFPIYGLMRFHDDDYEEHYEQWEEQQRRNYDQREPQ